MAAMVCDLCGGKLVMGAGGVAVCESCGMEHSPERMREKVQEIKGTVRVDNSHMVENYLNLARNAFDASNNKEAEDYTNKVIEIEPGNWEAWYIKAKAVGWQTTGKDNRFAESFTAWRNAMDNVPQERRDLLCLEIIGDLQSISFAIMKMKGDHFASFPDKDNKEELEKNFEFIRDMAEAFGKRYGAMRLGWDLKRFKSVLASSLNAAAVDGSNKADGDFGPEKSDKSDWAHQRYVEAQDACLSLLETALNYCINDDVCFTITKNYLAIAPALRDSCSYRFEANAYSSGYVVDKRFTDEAKKFRNKKIAEWEKKRDTYDPAKRKEKYQEAVTLLHSSFGEQALAAAKAKYWEDHAAEKAALEQEQSELAAQLKHLKEERENLPQRAECARIQGEIDDRKGRQKKLGLFKGAEKKALQGEIDQLEGQLEGSQSQLAIAEQNCDGRIAPVQNRMDAIQEELTRDRGVLPVAHRNIPRPFDDQGIWNVSPVGLAGWLSKALMPPYAVAFEKEENIVNHTEFSYNMSQAYQGILDVLTGEKTEKKAYVDDPTVTKRWQINLIDQTKGEDEKSVGLLFCFARSRTQNIQPDTESGGNYLELIGTHDPKNVVEHASVAAQIAFALCPSSDLNQLQEFLIKGAYRLDEEQEMTIDGVRIQCTGKGNRWEVHIWAPEPGES